eukprot:TRINITY_DN4682_c0_g1_i2.p1 TRINITY_DN4682_c0_g1~~TRINITY_DN4682_c0_g1_i2.p1  ORF type:complete len:348 (+),score=67.97 TRINITY_DN4682_c0_g1_i2:30-1046(+)
MATMAVQEAVARLQAFGALQQSLVERVAGVGSFPAAAPPLPLCLVSPSRCPATPTRAEQLRERQAHEDGERARQDRERQRQQQQQLQQQQDRERERAERERERQRSAGETARHAAAAAAEGKENRPRPDDARRTSKKQKTPGFVPPSPKASVALPTEGATNSFTRPAPLVNLTNAPGASPRPLRSPAKATPTVPVAAMATNTAPSSDASPKGPRPKGQQLQTHGPAPKQHPPLQTAPPVAPHAPAPAAAPVAPAAAAAAAPTKSGEPPSWTKPQAIRDALLAQTIDPDEIFAPLSGCDLVAIFGTKSRRPRTSSANWATDRYTPTEELQYKRDMGYRR